MPIYEYQCHEGHITEVYLKTPKPCGYIPCDECGRNAKRMFSEFNTDCVERERLSNSMGCHPDQIEEFERRFPGSRYTPDGRLRTMSRKDKLKKMKERGLVELD